MHYKALHVKYGHIDGQHLVLLRFHLQETDNVVQSTERERETVRIKRRRGDILKNKILFVLSFFFFLFLPFIELESKVSGRGREVEREKIEQVREWWQWPLLLSTLIATLIPVMLQRQPKQRGIGWRC